MVNRKKFGNLYAHYLQSLTGQDFQPSFGGNNKLFYDRPKNHHCYQNHARNYRNEAFESKDFRHACTMCPGDFSHTSCKYCLNDDVFDNTKEEFLPPCRDHEPRRHCYNNGYETFYEEPCTNYRKRNLPPSFEEGCEFCLKNGETAVIYSSHQFRNPSGTIACPLLKEYFYASYDVNDGGCYEPCSSNALPLYRPRYSEKRCRCCIGGRGDQDFCHIERASAVPLVRRLSNGFLSRQDYFDLLNLT